MPRRLLPRSALRSHFLPHAESLGFPAPLFALLLPTLLYLFCR
jgi:hypothetical protein